MDRDVIEDRIEALRHCLERIREKCPPTAQALAEDRDAQDIVALNLTRAVQICVDIAAHLLSGGGDPPPDTMAGAFESLVRNGTLDANLGLRLKKAVGFRNIVIHNYASVDWQIVHEVTRRHLDDFNDFARAVIRHTGG